MILFLALSALGLVALMGGVVNLFTDGYHRLPTDRTRLP